MFHSSGVVGHRLHPRRAPCIVLEAGDVLAMATDGRARAFLDDVSAHVTPEDLADRLLRRHARPRDDVAFVLVALYAP